MVHEVDPRELFTRYEGNPIIKPSAFPSMVNAAFNPAAVSFDGQTLLLIRVEDRTGLSRLVVATSDDGFTDWEIDMNRAIVPDLDCFEEQWGVEDPRITRDDDGDRYLIVYTGFSPGGPLVCLATTTDFRTFDKRGVIQSPEDKDAALFPKKFGRALGVDPSSGGQELGARRPHLAVVEPGPPSLGRLTDPAPRAEGGVVGCRQDRAGSSSAPDGSGVAVLLPRCAE